MEQRSLSLDPSVVRALGQLSRESGMEAIDNFEGSNMRSMRNPSAFFIGIIRRLQAGRLPAHDALSCKAYCH